MKKEVAFRLAGLVLILGLIAMVLLVGTAAALDDYPNISATAIEGGMDLHEFTVTDNVWGKGHFGAFDNPPDAARIYVVKYKENWTENDTLKDVSNNGYEIVTCPPNGTRLFKTVQVWDKPLDQGKYQLVLDLDYEPLGVYSKLGKYSPASVYDPIWHFNVTGRPEIEVNKTASLSGSCPGTDPLNVSIGDNVTYCFNVTNTGNVPLTNVSLFDDHYESISLGTDMLAPGESTEGTATHTVNESDIPSVTNVATVNATDPLNTPVNDTDNCTIYVSIAPEIVVNKTASLSGSCPGTDPLNVSIGDNVTYCFNVTNTGDVTLKNVTVVDNVYGPVTLLNITLAPGGRTGGTVTHVVVESDAPFVFNTATATGTDPLGGTVNDTDPCTINVTMGPDIEVIKTASLSGSCPGLDPLAVNISDNVTYCFNVTNTGNVNLTSVTVIDNIYGPVTLAISTLAPGKSTEGNLTHIVVESDAPFVINTATATGTDRLGSTVTDTDNCTINVTLAPDIEVIKTASLSGSCPGLDPLAVNISDNVTYCFNVTNTGNVNLTSVTVIDNIYGPVTLLNTSLAPGKSTEGNLTHIVVESDAPFVINTATATGTDRLGSTVTDTDNCTINVTMGPDIEVIKTASLSGSCPGLDPLAVNISDNVTYCFNVTNTGNVNLTSVTVIDNIYGSVTLLNISLAPGKSTEGNLTHIVVESDAPFVINTATATGTDRLGSTVTDTDNCTINVTMGPDIEVIKTASLSGSCPGLDPLAVNISDNVTYCFNVTNTGNVNLTSVTVIDNIYGPVTLATSTLAPGKSTEGNLTHIVVESDAPFVINTATATGTDRLGSTVTDTDNCTINVTMGPDIEVIKTASLSGSCPGLDPLAVNISDNVTYCFNVTNTGNVNLTSVTVIDNIYGPVTLAISTLAPGKSTEGNLTHIVVESDAPFVINTATATGTDRLGSTVTDTDNCTINVSMGPDIEVIKTASLSGSCPGLDPLAVNISDNVTYCFNVTNTGNVNLTSVTVIDNIYGPVTLAISTLAPGKSTEGNLTHIVVESDAPFVINTATATGTDRLGSTVTDTDNCTINVTMGPDIEVIKTASLSGSCPGLDPLAVNISDNVTYCFNVTNTGNVNLTSVTVIDNIYGSVTLLNISLAPGKSTEGNLTHIVVESDAPFVINTATATGTDRLGSTVTDTDNCTINVTMGPDIEVIKTASLSGSCPGLDPLAVNISDNVTYCFNVTNTGNVNLTSVTVIDNIYGSVTLLNISLAPGKSTEGNLTHIVVESDAPFVINTATATGTDRLGSTVTDTDNCTINVSMGPDIEVIKTASLSGSCPGLDPLAVNISDNVTYCFNVTNTGNVNLTSVTVIDNIYGPVTLAISTLAPGKSTEGNLTHIVVESDAPFVINTATATGTDRLGSTVTDTDNCTINVTMGPDIEVIKTASLSGSCPGLDPLAVNISDNVTYCFNVTNTGNVNLTSVTVIDNIYGSVTLLNISLAPGKSTEGNLTHIVVESDAPFVINTATATGTDRLGSTVTDTDNCTINVTMGPDIEVIKTASLSGSCPGLDPLAVNISDNVTYCFNVTNTGNVNLTSVTVIDNIYGHVTLAISTLAPGKSTEGNLTHIVVESDAPFVINTATATGTDRLGSTVTDTDNCTINVTMGPDIEVIKTASLSGSCPGLDPLAVNISDNVTYCFNVTNTGNVNLTSVTVIDNIYGPVTLAISTLAPGKSTEGNLTHIVVESDAPFVINTATATGTDRLGSTVTDTDNCTINVTMGPDIEVIKTASLSGSCPGLDPLAVNISDNVTYCFNVTNTGNVNLTSVTVIDNIYGPVTLATSTLAPGKSTEGNLTHIVVESDAPFVINTATATGTDRLGSTVTDTDNCTINVTMGPDIEVIKTASLSGSCPGLDPLAVNISDNVTYCFNVTNTGNVNLTSVTVIDNIYGPVTLATSTLAPGKSTEGNLTHIVVESDAPFVINTATATGTDPLGGTVTDRDNCTINVTMGPDIEVIKTASLTGSCPGTDPLAVKINDTVTYCFNVTNRGDVNLTGVTVVDDVYGPVTLLNTSLAPGGRTGGTITHVVVESDAPFVINTATATGTDPLGGTVTDIDNCKINVTMGPDIEVIKTASLSGACPGTDPLAVKINDTVTYCFNVTNRGDVNLTGVTVVDDIYGPVTLLNTSLAPGGRTGGTVTHVVEESDAPFVINTATATGTDPLGGTVTDTDDCKINVTMGPDIEVIKTASLTGSCPGTDPLAVKINDTVTYCFNVTNTGDVNLTGVTVVDDIYGPVTLLNISLAPGGRTGGTVTHVVEESDAPFVINTATATGTDPLGGTVTDRDNCTINVTMGPDIEVIKTASLTGSCPGTDPLAVKINDTVTYCFNVTNTGDVNLTGVTVVDDIYGPVTLLNISLAPGGRTGGTVTHVVEESDAPFVINTATATGTDPLGGTVTDTDNCKINVTMGPDIEVIKTASLSGSCPGTDPLAVKINDTVTYCFNVTNRGDVNLTGVTVVDDVYGPVTLLNISLAPGGRTGGTVTHVVEESDAPFVINTATATGTDPLGGTVTDTDDCKINVTMGPDIEVIKTASLSGSCPGTDPLAVKINDTVTYCFNVTNRGDVNLTGITVVDDVYGPVTLLNTSLAPGGRTGGTVTHVVEESDAPFVINTATATGTDPLGGTVTDTDDCKINVTMGPDIEVIKTASLTGSCPGTDPLAVKINDTVTYCFNVTNRGDVNLTGVTVVDDVYGPVTLLNISLAPGGRTGGTVTHVVEESDAPFVINTATATGTDPLGGTVTDTDDCKINVTMGPDIEVIKTASLSGSCPGTDPLAVKINDTVTYCFNVTNRGDVNLTGITVVDDIYGPVTLLNTSLAPGGRTGGTVTHVVEESDAPFVINTATATGTDPLGGTVTDTDDCKINVTMGPDIEVIKTASLSGSCPGTDPLAVKINDTVTYCFNVTNRGDVNLTGVTVVDDIYGPVTLLNTSLAPGGRTGGTVTHVVEESDAPFVINTATATGTDPLGGTVTDTDDCKINVTMGPDIEVIKTASLTGSCPGTDPLAVKINDTVTYCFNVTNRGDVNLTGVTVVDDIYGPVTLLNTSLAPGGRTGGTVTHVVVESDAPFVINTATATGTDPLGGTVTDTDDCKINVTMGPDIEVIKTASLTGSCPGTDPLAVKINDTVTYCFNVTNRGDVNLTGVTVVDDIYGPVTLLNTSLAPGGRTGGTVTHVVVESDAPFVINTATATGTDPLGGTVTDTDNCTINVGIHPDVVLEKTGSPAIVAPGGNVTYRIYFKNTGDVTLTNVTIIDYYPEGVTFISASPAPDPGTNNIWTWGDLIPGQYGIITINVTVPESWERGYSFTESGSVRGEGFLMVSKELSTGQKPYKLTNVVTLTCDQLFRSATAVTTVSGVPGTSMSITEHGSGIYESDESLNLCTRNRSISIVKTTNAVYKPTTFNFSKSFVVNFTPKWKQDIETKNCVIDSVIRKRITDATYIDDETRSKADNTSTTMEFDSSFNGSLYIGARTNDTAISETYIGEFDVLQRIQIGKGPIPSPSPTPTPTWLPCPYNDSQGNMTEDAEPTP